MAHPIRRGGSADHKVKHQRIEDEKFIEELYQFGGKLGQGSFGVVVEAKNLKTSERRAIKKVNKEKAGSSAITLLEREVSILKRVKHDHIIHLEEVLETARKMYLVMELCELGELRALLHKKGPFSETSTRHITGCLTSVIVYLHKDGIVHRDLKLENILVADCTQNEDGDPLYNIKLTDFGLSVVKGGVGSDSLLQSSCGTPVYMAPEVIQNHDYSQQCDNWSIGVILFALLSREYPFVAEKEDKLFELIKRGEVDFSKPVWQNVSKGAKSLICNLLNTDPAHRYTASEAAFHPWTLGTTDSAGANPINVLAMMKDYAKEMANNGEDKEETDENSDEFGKSFSDEEELKRPETSGAPVMSNMERAHLKVKTKSAPHYGPSGSGSTLSPIRHSTPTNLFPPAGDASHRGSFPSLKNQTKKTLSAPRKIHDNKSIGRQVTSSPVSRSNRSPVNSAKESQNRGNGHKPQHMNDHSTDEIHSRLSAARLSAPSVSNSHRSATGAATNPHHHTPHSPTLNLRHSNDGLRTGLQSGNKQKKKRGNNKQ